jgi:hypothetical protein
MALQIFRDGSLRQKKRILPDKNVRPNYPDEFGNVFIHKNSLRKRKEMRVKLNKYQFLIDKKIKSNDYT